MGMARERLGTRAIDTTDTTDTTDTRWW